MKTSSSHTGSRLNFLDCVRGVAAFAVLLEHVGGRASVFMEGFYHQYFSLGKFGVTAFFLTSGFVIPFSLERGQSLKRFWVSRVFRLYPLYWLSLGIVLTSFLLGVTDAVTPGFSTHFLRNSLVNITMLQGFVGVPNAEGLYYTLGMEMAFYFFASILFWKKLNEKSLQIAWIAATGLAAAGIIMPLVAHRRVPMAGLFYLLTLLIGTVIYRHFAGSVSGRALCALLGFVWLTTCMEIYCNYVVIKKADVGEQFTLWAVLLPWSVAYILFLAAYALRAREFPRGLAWLGAVSYSVYLLHPNVARLLPIGAHPVLYVGSVILITLVASELTYRLVERPFINLGRDIQVRLDREKAPHLSVASREAA
jgi:peptidoglycan/LPS O-acetylase OafA/YrhL